MVGSTGVPARAVTHRRRAVLALGLLVVLALVPVGPSLRTSASNADIAHAHLSHVRVSQARAMPALPGTLHAVTARRSVPGSTRFVSGGSLGPAHPVTGPMASGAPVASIRTSASRAAAQLRLRGPPER